MNWLFNLNFNLFISYWNIAALLLSPALSLSLCFCIRFFCSFASCWIWTYRKTNCINIIIVDESTTIVYVRNAARELHYSKQYYKLQIHVLHNIQIKNWFSFYLFSCIQRGQFTLQHWCTTFSHMRLFTMRQYQRQEVRIESICGIRRLRRSSLCK